MTIQVKLEKKVNYFGRTLSSGISFSFLSFFLLNLFFFFDEFSLCCCLSNDFSLLSDMFVSSATGSEKTFTTSSLFSLSFCFFSETSELLSKSLSPFDSSDSAVFDLLFLFRDLFLPAVVLSSAALSSSPGWSNETSDLFRFVGLASEFAALSLSLLVLRLFPFVSLSVFLSLSLF